MRWLRFLASALHMYRCMKKQTKKLTLRFETLRDLSQSELTNVLGGTGFASSPYAGSYSNRDGMACCGVYAFVHANPSAIVGGCGKPPPVLHGCDPAAIFGGKAFH